MWLLLVGALGWANTGVTLPLAEWDAMVAEVARAEPAPAIPMAVLQRHRVVSGVFERGVLAANVTSTIEVLVDGPVRVPVVDGRVAVGRARLDGKETSLLLEGAFYTVGVDEPGRHLVELDIYQGRDHDRFGRGVDLQLPPGGPTAIRVQVPESDIEATLGHGVVVGHAEVDGTTHVLGQLDASGQMDLTWKQRTQHQVSDASTEIELHALFTLHEALVTGVADVEVRVIDGQIDRVDLGLPEGMEVVGVTGDAVLQWHASTGDEDRLAVLLRYLADETIRLNVHFQFPVDIEHPVELRTLTALGDTPFTGSVGVQGPVGLHAEVTSMTQAKPLELHDLPEPLVSLTASPLIAGFAFEDDPSVLLKVTRQADIELTSTIIDEVQASTMVLQDGVLITKMQLRMRNNTRQYLEMTLPADAEITHSLIDGLPFRPGMVSADADGRIMIPLHQSEVTAPGGATSHTVSYGDTLSGIALQYYGDPAHYGAILAANSDQLYSASDIAVGQTLRIPATAGAAVSERAFVVELAYRQQSEALGELGSRTLSLPEVDVDVMNTIWHVYLPHSLEPIRINTNLIQLDHVHYGLARRVLSLVGRALFGDSAFAGDGYSSILSRRKDIYWEEQTAIAADQLVKTDFPMVGRNYRFRRVLMGTEVPTMDLMWVSESVASGIRWGALLLSGGLTVLAMAGGRDRRRWVMAVAGWTALLVLADHLVGVHRRMVWGFDLGMVALIARDGGWRFLRDVSSVAIREPWRVVRTLEWRSIGALFALSAYLIALTAFGVLASVITGAGLVAAHQWTRQEGVSA